MTEALLVWRWYSKEIESDFQRFYNLDSRLWIDGEMDSRRFLSLIKGLPDESLFKTWAVRRGDWTDEQYITARLVNEVALSRADGRGYMPTLVKSPMQMLSEQARQSFRSRKHSETLAELEGSSGDHP